MPYMGVSETHPRYAAHNYAYIHVKKKKKKELRGESESKAPVNVTFLFLDMQRVQNYIEVLKYKSIK